MSLVAVTGKMLLIIIVSIVFNVFIGTEASCKIPLSPEHGTLQVLGGSQVGSITLFFCDAGRKLAGSSHSKCLITGNWTFPPPKCVNSFCKAPKHPENGIVTYTTLHEGSELTFVCNNGHHLQDTRPVYCTSDGEWNKTDVKCVAKTCDLPNHPKHGHVNFESLTFQSLLKFKCDDGYFLKSDEPVFCTSDGTWSKTDVQCIARSCGEPGFVSNAHRIGNFFTFPNKVEFQCQEGYKIKGPAVRYCQASGLWSGKLPKCDRVEVSLNCSCSYNSHDRKLSADVNGLGLWNGDKVRKGDKVTLRCYDLAKHLVLPNATSISGTLELTCSDCRTWEDSDLPSCEDVNSEVSCERPLAPKNGDVHIAGIPKVGTVVVYSCKEGKTMVGPSATKCLITGEWTFPPPKCLSSCVLSAIPNGSVGRMETRRVFRYKAEERFVQFQEGKIFRDGETTIFHCSGGFEPVGSSQPSEDRRRSGEVVTCKDGQWSKSLECKPESCYGDPPPMDNGYPVVHRRSHGISIYYHCNRYYVKSGKTGNVNCSYGQWTGHTPTCIDGRCYVSQLNHTGLGKPPVDFIEHGKDHPVACMKGFEAFNQGINISCNAGNWSIPDNICVKEDCTVPWILNGHIEEQVLGVSVYNWWKTSWERKVTYKRVGVDSVPSRNATLVLVCQDGYSIRGTNSSTGSIICSRGRWFPNPVCLRSRCYVSQLNHTGLEKPPVGFIDHGKVHPATCMKGFIALNQGINVSCNAGNWSVPDNICVKEDCTVPWILNGHIEEQELGFPVYSWWEMSWEREVTYKRVGVDSVPSRNATLVLVCQDGYSIQGTNSSTGSIICSRGRWFPNPVCLRTVTCPQHEITKGMTVQYINGKRVNSTARFNCTAPFVLRGQSTLQCLQTGVWNHIQPICQSTSISDKITRNLPEESQESESKESESKKDCVCTYTIFWRYWNLKALFKGEEIRSTKNFSKGESIQIGCVEEGMRLVLPNGTMIMSESITWTCNRCGQWRASEMPTCEKVQLPDVICPQLEITEGITIKFTNARRVGSTATFSCTNHYVLHGSPTRHCLLPGIWNGIQPICRKSEVRCPPIRETDVFSVRFTNGRNINSTAHFLCKDANLKIVGGLDTRICQYSGEWSGANPDCEAPGCLLGDFVDTAPRNLLPSMEGVTSELQPVGSKLSLHCEEGWVVIGGKMATCGPLGEWNFGKAQCVPGCYLNIEEGESDVPLITPYKDYYRFGEGVMLSCSEGFELTSDVERLHCMGHGWSDMIPNCRKKTYK